MSDETLLSQADRKRIVEIVRVEVRLALRDLYNRMGYDRASAVGAWQHPGWPTPINDDWVYEEPFS